MDTNNLSALNEAVTRHNVRITDLSHVNWNISEHNIVYKTINIHNGKHYIGQHRTLNPCDEYVGSGLLMQKAVLKYGLSSFVKSILFDFDNFDDMNQKEKELVQLSNCFPYDSMSYNLMEGGHNGKLSEETRHKISLSKRGEKNPFHRSHGRKSSFSGKTILQRFNNDMQKYEAWRKKNSESHKGLNCGEKNFWHRSHGRQMPMNSPDARERSRLHRIGQHRTLEQRQNMSRGRTGKCRGEQHVFYKKSLKQRLKKETYIKINKTIDDIISPKDFMTEEELNAWKQKISKSFTGRIRIYNPITGQRHLIDSKQLQTYLDNGWVLGYNCSAIGGKIGIYNPSTCKTKYIYEDELQTFLDAGWKRGAYVNENKVHKVKVYNDIVKKSILIDPRDYVAYYYDGWSLDLPSHASKGRILIRNEQTHETKAIFQQDLQSYLDKGWKKGRFPNIKPKTFGNKKSKFDKFKNINHNK